MADGDLSERVKALEVEMESMREFRVEMKSAIGELRRDVGDIRQSVTTGLTEVKDQLREVVTGTLNSMPPWAAKQLTLAGIIIGALAALLGGLLATGAVHL